MNRYLRPQGQTRQQKPSNREGTANRHEPHMTAGVVQTAGTVEEGKVENHRNSMSRLIDKRPQDSQVESDHQAAEPLRLQDGPDRRTVK